MHNVEPCFRFERKSISSGVSRVNCRDGQASSSSSTAASSVSQSESESSPSELSNGASQSRADSNSASSASNIDNSLSMSKGSMEEAIVRPGCLNSSNIYRLCLREMERKNVIWRCVTLHPQKALKIPERWTPTMTVEEALAIMTKNATEDSNLFSLENIFHIRDENPLVVDIDDVAKRTLFVNPAKAHSKLPSIEEFSVSKQVGMIAPSREAAGACLYTVLDFVKLERTTERL